MPSPRGPASCSVSAQDSETGSAPASSFKDSGSGRPSGYSRTGRACHVSPKAVGAERTCSVRDTRAVQAEGPLALLGVTSSGTHVFGSWWLWSGMMRSQGSAG